MARFFWVTIPVTGHVSPLLPVTKKLVERGHTVRWYTSARFQRRIEAQGATLVPYRSTRDLDYENLNTLFPERARLKGVAQAKWDLRRLVIDFAVEQMEDPTRIVDELSVDVVVGDSMAASALLIAEKKNLPVALINVLNLFAPSMDTAPDGLALPPSATQRFTDPGGSGARERRYLRSWGRPGTGRWTRRRSIPCLRTPGWWTQLPRFPRHRRSLLCDVLRRALVHELLTAGVDSRHAG